MEGATRQKKPCPSREKKVLERLLGELFPPVEDVAYNGLQVEGGDDLGRGICFAVTANRQTIEWTIARGAKALVVHHGLFWKGGVMRLASSLRRNIKLLLDHEINLYAYHLPLDLHPQLGNNWPVARLLGLEQLMPFGRFGTIAPGVVGSLPSSADGIDSAQLEKRLMDIYGLKDPISYAAGSNVIRKIAVCSGGAHKELLRALEEGCDAFITGTQDEPQWHLAMEEGISFFPLGHHASERVGPKLLLERVEQELLKEKIALPCYFLQEEVPY